MDARDFLRAWRGGLIEHLGRGLYRAPRSFASEQFFSSGLKSVNPRPITLWIEPVITVAVLARLHFDLGWPSELIGTQSKNWEFDVTAFLGGEFDIEYISCEVKKSSAEISKLIDLMVRYGRDKSTIDECNSPSEINAFRKLAGLRNRNAPFFWAVGPNAINSAFRMSYAEGGAIFFEPVEPEAMAYPAEK